MLSLPLLLRLHPLIAYVSVIDVTATVLMVGKALFIGGGSGGIFGKSVFCFEQLKTKEDMVINNKWYFIVSLCLCYKNNFVKNKISNCFLQKKILSHYGLCKLL
jgi:uncharacterized integral membrane protein